MAIFNSKLLNGYGKSTISTGPFSIAMFVCQRLFDHLHMALPNFVEDLGEDLGKTTSNTSGLSAISLCHGNSSISQFFFGQNLMNFHLERSVFWKRSSKFPDPSIGGVDPQLYLFLDPNAVDLIFQLALLAPCGRSIFWLPQSPIFRGKSWCISIYPLVNIQTTMENHHFSWENSL